MSADSSNAPLASGKSPKAGCAIMMIIFTVVSTLIGITITLPFLQMKKMEKFTSKEPVEFHTKDALPEPPAELAEKLMSQKARLTDAQEPVELTYTVEELNQAIRSYEIFSELQGTMAVKEITPEGIKVDICFQLNHNPLSSDKSPRYLIAEFTAKVAQKNDELILKVTQGTTAAGEISEGFMQHFQEYRFMQPYTDHPQIGRVMFAASEVTHGDGMLTIVVDPGKYRDPAGIKPVENHSDKQRKRRVLMPLMSFLMVGAIFIFMVRRRNAREAKRWKSQADQE